jgi:hypothetical protein
VLEQAGSYDDSETVEGATTINEDMNYDNDVYEEEDDVSSTDLL